MLFCRICFIYCCYSCFATTLDVQLLDSVLDNIYLYDSELMAKKLVTIEIISDPVCPYVK